MGVLKEGREIIMEMLCVSNCRWEKIEYWWDNFINNGRERENIIFFVVFLLGYKRYKIIKW